MDQEFLLLLPQGLYDGIFLMGFNLLFTSLPVLFYGLLEQNYSAQVLMRQPYLYKLNKNNYLMSRPQFMMWLLLGEQLCENGANHSDSAETISAVEPFTITGLCFRIVEHMHDVSHSVWGHEQQSYHFARQHADWTLEFWHVHFSFGHAAGKFAGACRRCRQIKAA